MMHPTLTPTPPSVPPTAPVLPTRTLDKRAAFQPDPQLVYTVERGLLRVVTYHEGTNALLTVRHVLPGDVLDGRDLAGADLELQTVTLVTLAPRRREYLTEQDLREVITSQLAQTDRMLAHRTSHQASPLESRLARYLLFLATTPAAHDQDGETIVAVSHEFLAEGIASTRESVSKIVAEYRHAGLIDTGYRCIRLVDLEGLRAKGEGA